MYMDDDIMKNEVTTDDGRSIQIQFTAGFLNVFWMDKFDGL